ncbi:MAG TPA: hypothetical protein VLL08_09970 [Kineosporiaceae bacterium]|nr:hypothetical protein [Kineosporiaceae bacterium]
MDLEDATSELYALTPAGFTARRTELVAQARQEGLKGLAKEISELRRPTVSAWLVNQLVRGAGGAEQEIEELEALGVDLRAAQAQLDGPRMKELTKSRQKLVAALLKRAETIADDDDQKVSASTRRELEETLGAAIADEQASLAVTSGRLTRALVYAGFGEVDVTAATATPVTARRRPLTSVSKHRPAEPGSATSAAESAARATATESAARAAATEAADLARADEAAAAEDLATATRYRDEIRAKEVERTETLDELQREIVRVRHELDDLTRSLAAAERDHQRRERQLDQARKAVRQAEQALNDMPPG